MIPPAPPVPAATGLDRDHVLKYFRVHARAGEKTVRWSPKSLACHSVTISTIQESKRSNRDRSSWTTSRRPRTIEKCVGVSLPPPSAFVEAQRFGLKAVETTAPWPKPWPR